MLQDTGARVESETWTPAAAFRPGEGLSEALLDWRVVDRRLRSIASRRAALDAEEAAWLREAERCQIWRRLGMVSALDYMERVLGYGPRTAQDRLRVARSLGNLPLIAGALSRGELSFSAVRELTRVATSATEAAWLNAAAGKSLRQVEELVADHRPGDRPEDPRDPEARIHIVRMELGASTFALLRQTRGVLDAEHGSRLSDDELIAQLCHAALEQGSVSGLDGRARYQVAMVVCERCRQGWQEGAGARIAVDAATIEQAECDAQQIGSIDGAGPERAYQDVAPSVMRLVWRRDGGRCRIPGCRSARSLEIHHVVHREDGGGHEPINLILACFACHSAHHRGLLRISGTAEDLCVERCAEQGTTGSVEPGGPVAGGDDSPSVAEPCAQDAGLEAGPVAGDDDSAGEAEPRVLDGALGAEPVSGGDDSAGVAELRALDGALEAEPVAGGDDGASVAEPRALDAALGAGPVAGGDGSAGVAEPRALDAALGTGHAVALDDRGVARSERNEMSRAEASGAPTWVSDQLGVVKVSERGAARSGRIAVSHAEAEASGAPTWAPDQLGAAVLRTLAKEALIKLRWKPAIAGPAVAAAARALPASATLEQLIFEALRRCQRPGM